MIRQRMQHAIEDKLSATQYGFRPKRSTYVYISRYLHNS